MNIPNCWICLDRGFTIYKQKINGIDYDFVAHCICKAGANYNYDGSKCKIKVEYKIPPIPSIMDTTEIAKANLTEFCKQSFKGEDEKKEKEIEDELKKRGIDVDMIKKQLEITN